MNIIDKIKVGDILYSTIAGEVIIMHINFETEQIRTKNSIGLVISFSKEGKYYSTGECVLFPSKENRDWSTLGTTKMPDNKYINW